MQGETEIYREGALYVADLGRYGYAVKFDYGLEKVQEHPLVVPPRTPQAKHPTYVGQEHKASPHFRTKTGAKKYMHAVASSGVLPSDRPATKQEVTDLKNWIEGKNER